LPPHFRNCLRPLSLSLFILTTSCLFISGRKQATSQVKLLEQMNNCLAQLLRLPSRTDPPSKAKSGTKIIQGRVHDQFSVGFFMSFFRTLSH
jgi:hypothetical protein